MPFGLGPPLKLANLQLDERTNLLGGQTNLRVLAAHECPATTMAKRALHVALLSTVVFSLVVWSYVVGSGWGPLSWLLYSFGILLTIFRVLVVLVLLASVVYAQYWKSCYRKAIIFWAWLPCVHIIHCSLALVVGNVLGHFMYQTYLGPYHELSRLKVYKGINPAVTSGTEVMDAGLVEFNDYTAVGIDRARGSCYKNYGHTYCIAPIVNNGKMTPIGTGNSPSNGMYDYFAVGVDCCTCPNTDFRCGEWFNPDANGGLRSIDADARPFYHLAVDNWAASYGKDVGHPVFFTWVQDPVRSFNGYWEKSIYIGVLTVLLWLVTTFTCALMLAQAFQVLIRNSIASPLDTPPPPPGLEKIWYWFLPSMLYFAEEERRQYLGLPESEAPFYPPAPSLDGHREPYHDDEDARFRHALGHGPAYAPGLMAANEDHPAQADHGFLPAPGVPEHEMPFNQRGYHGHLTYGYHGLHHATTRL